MRIIDENDLVLGAVLHQSPDLVVDAASGPELTIGGTDFVLTADYARSGPDLALTGADGEYVLIKDFFAVETAPDLLTPWGARITGDLATKLAGPETPGQYAQAAGGNAAEPVGEVEIVDGTASVTRADGTQEALDFGTPIFQGDILQTGADGVVGIIFIDGMTMSLDEQTRVVVDEMFYDPGANDGGALFSVVNGALVFVSGEMAKIGPDAMQVDTPTGTIGIRGTHAGIGYKVVLDETSVVLFENPGGGVGAIAFTTRGGVTILDQINQITTANNPNAPPTAPVIVPLSQAQSFFGRAFSVNQDTLEQRGELNQQKAGLGAIDGDVGEFFDALDAADSSAEQVALIESVSPAFIAALTEAQKLILVKVLQPGVLAALSSETQIALTDTIDSLDEETLIELAEETSIQPDPSDTQEVPPFIPVTQESYFAALSLKITPTAAKGPILTQQVVSLLEPSSQTLIADPTVTEVTIVTKVTEEAISNILLGTDGPDTIAGSAGTQFIFGLGSDDQLFGLGGNDTIFGESGNDTLFGGDGNDILDGGTGNDSVFGGAGNDLLIGGSGEGNDLLDGGAGNDVISYKSTSLGIQVDLLEGVAFGIETDSDVISNVEVIQGGSGADDLRGSNGNDVLIGRTGADNLEGRGGDDLLVGGGGGNDAVYYLGDVRDYTIIRLDAGTVISSTLLASFPTLLQEARADSSFSFLIIDNNLSDGDDGTDTVTGVEMAIFANAEINLGQNNAPIADNASFSVVEGQAAGTVVGAVLAFDPDGDTILYQIDTGNSAGLFQIDTIGLITTTAPLNFDDQTSHSLSVLVTDQNGLSTISQVEINVVDVSGGAPVANPDVFLIDKDVALQGSVFADNGSGIDFDPDGDTFGATAVNGNVTDIGSQVSLASGALLTLNADGTFFYDQNGAFSDLLAGATGTDSFTYTITDSGGLSSTATATVTITGTNASPIAVLDNFTGAGTGVQDPDLFIGGVFESSAVLLNNGDGTFVSSGQTFSPYDFVVEVSLGDVDGDGDVDAITANTVTLPYGSSGGTYSGDARILLNDGTGTFTDSGQSLAPTSFPSLQDTGYVEHARFADLDGDGDLDVLVTAYSYIGPNYGDRYDATIFLNDGLGNFTANGLFQSGNQNLTDIALGDLDNDGDVDVLLAASDSNAITLFNDGAGNFTAGLGVFDASLDNHIGDGAEGVLIADFDGDGLFDVLSAGGLYGTTVLLEARVGGNISHEYFASAYSGFVAADLDGDGDLDLLGAKYTSGQYNYGVTDIVVLFNNGNGTFVDSGQVLGTTDDFGLPVFGDIDGDGDVDFATTLYGSGTSLFINDGAGNFTVSQTGLGPTSAFSIAIADLDGDAGGAILADAVTLLDPLANDTDPDGDTLTITAVGASSLGAAVTIDAGGLTLSYDPTGSAAAAALAAGETVTDTFTYTISDGNGGTATQTISVQVTGVGSGNSNQPPLAQDATFALAENLIAGEVVGTVVASDPDTADTLNYAITAGDADGNFLIDTATGEITTNRAFDFETEGPFSLTVTVTDDGIGNLTDTATVAIAVTDANDAPVALDASFSVAENLAAGAVVGTVFASDQDTADTLSYAITAGDAAGNFLIDAATGEITTTRAFDFETEGPFSLTVTVTDDGTGTLMDTATVAVAVTDANDAPVALDANFSVAENLAAGAIVGTVSASDQDTADTLSYAITAGDAAGNFLINSATGEITTTRAFDFETEGPFSLTVTVTDDGTGTLMDTATVAVAVTDANDAPVALDASFSVAENLAAGAVVGTVSASDQDTADTLSYAITAGDAAGNFLIDAATGEITTTRAFDFETEGPFSLTVTVTDDGTGSLTDTATVAVAVTDANDAPVASDASFAVDELLAAGAVVGTVAAIDEDAGDTLTFAITAGDPASDFSIDAATGEITTTRTLFTGEDGPFALTVTATDGGGAVGTATVNIAVGDVNQAPVAQDATFNFAENQIAGTVVGTVIATDADPIDTLTYAITAGDPAGNFAIDAATGEITSTRAFDFEAEGPFNLTVTVTDNGVGSLTDTATVAIAVTDANDAPVALDASFSVAENLAAGAVVGTVFASDQDTADTLSYAITAGDAAGNFLINSATGEITTTRAFDFETEGPFSLTVTVTDDGTGTLMDTATVAVAVTDANDAPVALDANFSVAENLAAGAIVGTVSASDQDTADTLSYAITAGDAAGNFLIDAATGEITTTRAFDFETEGPFSLTVTVTDDGTGTLMDTATVAVAVTDANDAPVALDANFSVAENLAAGAIVGTVSASDQDTADTLSYAITAGDAAGNFLINSATGEITTTRAFDFETEGPFSLTVTVTDDGTGSLTDTATVAVAVTDANDAPVALDASFSVAENLAAGAVVGTVSASDQDTADTLSYAITAGDAAGNFLIDAATGEITTTRAFDFETEGPFSLTVTVTDDGTGTLMDTATVAVAVTDANDAPVALDASFSVAENLAAGAIVGTVSASDQDTADILSYAITAGDAAGNFLINSETGEITTTRSFDFETEGPFSLTVTVTDDGTGTLMDTATVAVAVTDANDAPVALDASFSVAENLAAGAIVGTVSASDQDTADILSYAITAGDAAGNFLINSETGEITTTRSFDFETEGPFSLTVTVTDDGTGTLMDTATVAVAVTDANDAPVAVDDFLGLPDLDIFLVRDGESDRVLINDGSGIFSDSGQALSTAEGRGIDLGDLDGDGDLDAFVANSLFGGTPDEVYLNDGAGVFTSSGQSIGNVRSRGVALGDLDGDGDLDAFTVAGNQDPNLVYLNDGSGIFTVTGQVLGTGSSYSVQLTDVEGDGDLDAIVTDRQFGAANLLYLNDGTGTFTDSMQALGTGSTFEVALGDLDGDGDDDAVIANAALENNQVFLNNAGTFTDTGQALGGRTTVSVALGDLDGDGDLDAFFGNTSNDQVFFNDGAGNFTDSGQFLASFETDSVELLDADRDGDLDAIISNGTTGNLLLYLNDGAGNFSDSGQILGTGTNLAVEIGDLDGDSVVILANTTSTLDVLANDTDQDTGDVLTITAVGASALGAAVTIGSGGLTLDYDPTGVAAAASLGNGETLVDTFTYTISDGNGGTDTATVSVTVTGVNGAPVAVDDAFNVSEDAILSGDVFADNGSGADSDPEGDTFNVTAVNGSATDVGTQVTLTSGALLTLNAGGTFSYDQNGVFNALAVGVTTTDSFNYTITDAGGLTGTATATITITGVNDAPVVVPDAFAVNEDAALSGNVFDDNGSGADSDPEGDAFSVTAVNGTTTDVGTQVTLTSGALLTLNADGTFSYDQNGVFNALAVGVTTTDSFTYTIRDSLGLGSTAPVIITINGVNDAPVVVPDAFAVNEDAALSGNVFDDNGSGADSDPEGDAFSVTAVNGTTTDVGTQVTLTSGALLTLNADGTFSYDQNGVFNALAVGVTTTDSFTYTIRDSLGLGSTAPVIITINGVNDAPVVVPDAFAVNEDAALSGNVFDDNGSGADSDPEGDAFSVTAVNGTTTDVGTQVTLTSGALLTLNADGTFSYDQNGVFNALAVGVTTTDSFTYTIRDSLGLGSTAPVIITINGVNDAPVVVPDAFAVNEDAALSGNVFDDNGSGADSDPEGDAFSVTAVNGTTTDVGTQVTLTSGALLTLNADGTFSYDQNGVFNALAVGVTTTDSFTYTIRDSLGLGSTAPVIITINGVNDAPVVVPDAFAVNEDAALSGNVFDDNGSGADSDPEGDAFSVTAVNGTTTDVGTQVTLTSGALLTLNADGTFSYDQNGVFNALAVGVTTTDSFTYTIRDSLGLGSTAPVIITITGVNDDPFAADDIFGFADLDVFIANVGTSPDVVLLNDGSGTLVDTAQTLGTSNGAGVAVGDLDGDGDLDAFVVNILAQADQVYFNDGTGSFTPSGQAFSVLSSSDVELGDLDGDGDLDAFVTSSTLTNADKVYLNDGSGIFTDTGQTLGLGQSYDVELADVDGDGDLDAIVADYDFTGVNKVYLNDGTGTFTDSLENLGTGPTFDIAAGDVDGDGDIDVVVARHGDISSRVYLNDGNGAFTDSEQSGLYIQYAAAVALGDLDGDGDLDAYFGDSTYGDRVFLNNGAGVFTDSLQSIGGAFATNNVEFLDVDQDGDLDAILSGDQTRLFLNDGAGVFTDSGQILSTFGSQSAAVGDLDGDSSLILADTTSTLDVLANDTDQDAGDVLTITAVGASAVGAVVTIGSGGLTLDYDPTGVAAAGSLGNGETLTDTFTYTISDGNGGSSTATATVTVTGVNAAPIAVDDVLGIADVDIFVIDDQGAPDRVFLNDGTGVFADTGQLLGTSSGFGGDLGDLDGDGDLDAFIANIGAEADEVYFNDGAGNFTISGQVFGTASSGDIALGDLDGDGDLDAFVANASISQSDQVYLNDGTGQFTDTGQSLGFGSSYSVELADVDGDGDLDAFVTDLRNSVSDRLYLNDGSGVFTDSGQVLGTGQSFEVAIGDLDGDGDADAIFADLGTNENLVYLNDGTGTFADSGQILGANATFGVSLGDLDGDGDLDAFFANSGNNLSRVYFNDGNGIFTDGGQTIFASNVISVELTDADQDGDLDAILGGTNGLLLLNDGTGTFTDSGQNLGTGGFFTALGDLDGDSNLIFANVISTLDVLANDADPDASDTVSISAVGASALGAVVTIGSGGLTLDYDPSGVAAAQQLGDGETLVDTFTYTISDGNGGTDTATATITITGVNAAPIATDDFLGLPDLDVFVANASGRSEQVYLNDGLGNFTDTGQTIGASASTDSAVGDLDSDGDLDVVVANSGGQANLVYFNDGGGNLTDSGALLGAVNTVTVALGDVDLDGDLDAIFGNAAGLARADKVYLNDGSGGFTDSGQTLGNASTSDLVFADVDSDGDLDILAGHRDAAVANVLYLNDGTGVFSDSGQSLGIATTVTMAAGDFDGDGDIDFLTGNYAGGDTVWLNDGTGTFTDSGQSIGTSNSSQITLADLDGDGDLDAFAASGNYQADRVYFNDGNGVFTDSGQALDAFFSTGVELGDVDRDGDLDAIVSTLSLEEIVYLNDGSGVFTNDGVGLSGSNGSVDLKLADLDGDSSLILANATAILDVLANDADGDPGDTLTIVGTGTSALGAVVTIGSGGLTLDYDPSGVAAAQQLADGETLTDTLTYTISDGRGGTATATAAITITGVNAAPVAADDVLGFPDLDVFVANGQTGPDNVLLNDGLGIFTNTGQSLGATSSLGLAVGDLDGDGDIDAFVATTNGDPNLVYLNDGNAVFTDSGQTLGSSNSAEVALGDLDGDGDLDAFVANANAQADRIYLNDGSGNFTDSGQALGLGRNYGVELADVDGDGDLDALVSEYTSGVANKLYLNDGTGVFTDSGQSLGTGAGIEIAAGDLDGDGDIDVMFGNFVGGNLVLLNDGTGIFADTGQLLGTSETRGIELADWDGDGDLDAFVANGNGQADRFYLNDGNGVFTDSGQIFAALTSFGVKAGDVDQDGDIDAVVVGGGGNRLFLNDGTGTFTDSGQSLGFGNSFEVALADLDGDSNLILANTTTTLDVLANDTDTDAGDLLTIIGVGTSALGAIITIDAGGLTLNYDPTGVTAAQQLANDETLTDSFTYTVDDGRGGLSTATVSLSLTGNEPVVIDLTGLSATDGFIVQGDLAGDRAGFSVSDAGDVNGDGFDDVIVGATGGSDGGAAAGEAYVIFGKASGFGTVDLTGLLASDGFIIQGDVALDEAGYSVASAGDVNGDGFDDLIVGARGADGGGTDAGAAYVIFGRATGPALIDLTGLTAIDGFRIQGDEANDYSGRSVSSAGDINGDGFDDVIIGAHRGDDGGNAAGEAYVIFGKNTGFSDIDLTTLTTADGFIIQGDAAADQAGRSVSSAGDVNGDGFDDLIVGAIYGAGGGLRAGEAYVIFGKDTGFGAVLDLGLIAPTDGFIIQGDTAEDRLGRSVSGAGDVNGDGYDDLIVSAPYGDNGGISAGEAYVIFGKASVTGTVDLTGLAPADGFIIQGDEAFDYAGLSVSGAGDVNGDGFDDVIVGALFGDDGGSYAGEAYVIFGKASGFGTIDLSGLAPTDGFIIQGDEADDQLGRSVSGAGDVDGDGFDDLIVGAAYGDDGGYNAGEAYVIFGGNFTGAVTLLGTAGADILIGTAGNDNIIGAQGDDTIIGGAGDDRMAGAFGDDTFVLADGSGNDVISGFSTGAGDIIDLSAFGFADFAALSAAMTESLGDVTIQLDADDSLVLEDVAIADLVAADFAIGNEPLLIDMTGLALADGFIIQGDAAGDRAGWSVSDAGDINGDGFADVIVGATRGDDGGYAAGEAYVVFGKASGFGTVDLTGLSAADGFIIQGDVALDQAGYSVGSAGDVNGDGFDDLIVGASGAAGGGTDAGAAYVIFGRATGPALIDLTGLTAIDGFRIQGDEAYDYSGRSVSGAGDINGDGFDDVIIGAHRGDDGGTNAGEAYVIFGKATGFTDIDLTTLNIADGFIIQGDAGADQAGRSVSSAGDVNGDGFDDLIVGAIYGAGGGLRAGEAYVIFGKNTGFGTVDLGLLTPADGFIIQGDTDEDRAGWSVSGAGDVNGDGYDDVIIGTPFGDDGGGGAGEAYVVFGKTSGFGTIDLTGLAPADGFIIQGDEAGDLAGWSVSGAGDVNGDGFDDVIVGARWGDDGGDRTGEAYVVFGKASGFGTIDLSALVPADGFIIQGDAADDRLGRSVSGAGDVDGDGFDDLIVGAYYGDDSGTDAGEAYVIFGGNFTSAVTLLGTAGADILIGTTGNDNIIGAQGDDTITGGAGDDRMAGAFGDDTFVLADGSGNDVISGFSTGAGDIIDLSAFGFADFAALSAAMTESLGDVTIQLDIDDSLVLEDVAIADLVAADFVIGNEPSVVIDMTGLSATDGFVIQGDEAGDQAGFSVSDAGDVNGDGFDDVIVGALGGDDGGNFAGEAYVVFGKASGFGPIDLTGLSATDGFIIQGDLPVDLAGYSVGSAGDVNGDGFDDVIVGARSADGGGSYAGAAYVIFGKAAGIGTIDLTGLSLVDGFSIQGDEADDRLGRSVSGAGDVNGDGFGDLIVGAYFGDDGGANAGEAYVIFGKASGFGNIDLTGLTAADGFIIQGDVAGDWTGFSVSSAGDVNGDGFDDVVAGAPRGDDGGASAGEAYVIFGRATGPVLVDLTGLTATDGFIIQGDVTGDQAGFSVSGAGDVNGDGYDDLIVGTPFGDDGGNAAGEAYVIFGKASAFGTVDLTGLSAAEGFIIQGDVGVDRVGFSVSGAGDVNGDGFDDLIVGTPYGADGGIYAGEAYVIFGKASVFGLIDLSDLAPTDGFIIQGDVADDRLGQSVSGAGDIDGDGFDDLIVGAKFGDDGGTDAGEAYVIFGGNFTGAVTLLGTAGADVLTGTAGGDVIFAGLGDDTIDGAGGIDRLSGGAGDDDFVVQDTGSLVTIIDFEGGVGLGDRLELSAFGFADFAAVQAAASASGPGGHDTLIQLDADDSVLLEDFEVADLNIDDVVIA